MSVVNQFIPLNKANQFVPIPLESFAYDAPLPCAIYLRVAGSMVRFRNASDVITAKRAKSLIDRKVDAIYVLKEDWLSYVSFAEKKLKEEQTNPVQSEQKVTQLRHVLLAYSHQLEDKENLNQETFDKTKELLFRLAADINQDPSLGSRLLRKYEDPQLYATNHGVNVAIYCASIASKLKLSVEQMRTLTLSAFLHDVGNLFIHKDLLEKNSEYTPLEESIMHSHTQKGFGLLHELFPTIPDIALTALQHHEEMDGTGYPNHLKGTQIHLYARICKIADVFDELTHPRPSVPNPLSLEGAIQYMRCLKGVFDPALFGTDDELNSIVDTLHKK